MTSAALIAGGFQDCAGHRAAMRVNALEVVPAETALNYPARARVPSFRFVGGTLNEVGEIEVALCQNEQLEFRLGVGHGSGGIETFCRLIAIFVCRGHRIHVPNFGPRAALKRLNLRIRSRSERRC